MRTCLGLPASAAQRFDEHVLKIKRGFQAATRNTKFMKEAAN
jgi:hypothetical protein